MECSKVDDEGFQEETGVEIVAVKKESLVEFLVVKKGRIWLGSWMMVTLVCLVIIFILMIVIGWCVDFQAWMCRELVSQFKFGLFRIMYEFSMCKERVFL